MAANLHPYQFRISDPTKAIIFAVFNMPVWFEFTWSLDEVDLGNGSTAWILWHSNSNLSHNATYRFVVSIPLSLT